MQPPSVQAAVVMQLIRLDNRWQPEKWEVIRVVPDASPPGTPASVVYEDNARVEWLHPGFALSLHRDEAEGYFLNLSTPRPFVFVMWREENGTARPCAVTASYNEAARLLDAGEPVDGVPMPAEWIEWLRDFAAIHYRPEPKKQRIRPPSFKGARRDE
ncbi:MAG: DUF3305 domain-containing protein [Betaproteobacteria bacterium]|nr:DUF3305 domain-containing protein [Betaproteobacteria bacterium]